MNLTLCAVNYRTNAFDDSIAGCAGLELLAVIKGQTTCIGKITFWDASGQFVIEMAGTEAPLEIVEKFISEAKQSIRTS